MRTIIQKSLGFVLLAGLMLSPNTHAAMLDSNGFRITLEPILGYEFFHRDTPTPHKAGMFIYGARFTAGRPHIALEGEYTRGTDTEAFTTPSILSVSTQKDNVRVGGRATYDLGKTFDVFGRFGGQASKVSVSSTDQSGVTSKSVGTWEIHPYLGAGIQLNPADFFSLGLEANYVFYSLSDYTKNSVQFSSAVRLHFNTR